MQEDPFRGDNPYESPEHAGGSAAPEPGHATHLDNETRTWAILLHLSQYAGHVSAGLGFVVPLLIWLLKRDELPGLEAHGRAVMNWCISEILYLVVFGLLSFVFVGIPFLIGVLIMGLVFPIIGAIKANDGVAWNYPLAIRFL